MKKKILFMLVLPLMALIARAQSGRLPVKEWGSHPDNPFILYLSGDGGFNRFSLDLCTFIYQAGYSITAIDDKSYFGSKKTPEQATLDISNYLNKQFKERQNQDLILVGYSFGADVLPFIVNRLPANLRSKLKSTLLISPSSTTDFETHWTDMLGYSIKRDMNVIAEINKSGNQKIITLIGKDESDFPVKDIKLKNYSNVILPGGHHFNGDTMIIGQEILKYL